MNFIKHPLICTLYLGSDQEKELLNKALEKRLELSQSLLEKEDFFGYLTLIERPFRFSEMFKHFFDIKKEDLAQIVEWVWIDSEDPCVNLEAWELIFNHCQGMKVFEESKKELPSGKFKVYRGTKEGVEDKGISWTLNKEIAEFFANRYFTKKIDGAPLIKEMEITKEDVLFYTNKRNEEEVIILPK